MTEPHPTTIPFITREEVLKISLEEYKTLRQESLKSMSNQIAVFNISVILIGTFITAGVYFWDKTIATCLIYGFFGPICLSVMSLVYLGEVGRMMRAGKYLADLENLINRFSGIKILNWENFLRTKVGKETPQLKFLYKSVLTVYFGSGLGFLAGAFLWFYTKWSDIDNLTISITFTIIGSLFYIIIFFVALFKGCRLSNS
jgi:hypothetical protein